MNEKICRIKIENRTFQIKFWDDDALHLPYVSVSEITVQEVKPHLFSRKRILKEVAKPIGSGWTKLNRAKWAISRISEYLQEERDKITESHDIEALCNNGTILTTGAK